MGIVQKQKKEIENLKAKNRMIKRLYEDQREKLAETQLSYMGLERVLRLTVLRLGGELQFTSKDLRESDKYETFGMVRKDGTMELLTPGLLESAELEKNE